MEDFILNWKVVRRTIGLKHEPYLLVCTNEKQARNAQWYVGLPQQAMGYCLPFPDQTSRTTLIVLNLPLIESVGGDVNETVWHELIHSRQIEDGHLPAMLREMLHDGYDSCAGEHEARFLGKALSRTELKPLQRRRGRRRKRKSKTFAVIPEIQLPRGKR